MAKQNNGKKPSTGTNTKYANVGGTKMTAADTAGLSKAGFEIKQMPDGSYGRKVGSMYQPNYVKKASSKKPTTTKPVTTTTKAAAQKPKEPKERVAYRSQTIIDEKGNKTVKSVAYSRYNEKTKKWESTGAPTLIDKRKK